MTSHPVSMDYVNNLVYELEKAFWDERGRGARFRLTTVGRGYFRERCQPKITSLEPEAMLGAIAGVLREDGVVTQVSHTSEDRLWRVRVEGCVHRPVEERMIAHGVEPFTCLPANLLVLAIEQKLDRPVELAQIKVEEGACHLLLVMFDQRPRLD